MVKFLVHLTFIIQTFTSPQRFGKMRWLCATRKNKIILFFSGFWSEINYPFYDFIKIPFSFYHECIQLFTYFSLTHSRDESYKAFIGYPHLPCNLHSAKLCLFYYQKNGLLYYAYKYQKDINNIKNKLAALQVNLFYPIRGCSRSESGSATEMVGNISKNVFFIRIRAFNGIIISCFPRNEGEMWCTLAGNHQKKAILVFCRTAPQLHQS